MFSCGLRRASEQEPNDSPAAATPFQGSVDGEVNGAGDIDYFRVQLKKRIFRNGGQASADDQSSPSGYLVGCTLEGDQDLDLVLRVFHGDKLVKMVDDHGPGDVGLFLEGFAAAYFSAEELSSGRALISVEPHPESAAAGEYTLAVAVEPVQQHVEIEPNDRMVTASPVGENGTVRGYFSPNASGNAQEVDWYSFAMPVNSSDMVVHLSLSAVPDVDSSLGLYDELGYVIRRADSKGPGEGEKLKNVGLEGGTYFIKVASGENQSNHLVGYVLKIEAGPAEGELEPNDRYTHANRVQFSEDITGFINPVGDSDWYRMVVYDTDRQVITVKIGPTADIDPILEFYGGPDERLILVDDRGRDQGEIIKNIGVREGIYYVKVYSSHQSQENPNDPYVLLIEKEKWGRDEEFEINNSAASANRLVLGGMKRGYITPRGDRDFYSFEAKRTGVYTIEVTPCLLLDLALHLYSEEGELLEKINEMPEEEGEKATLLLDKGRYYVSVVNMNAYENSRDAYMLRVSIGADYNGADYNGADFEEGSGGDYGADPGADPQGEYE
jgi:hypothetical protein